MFVPAREMLMLMAIWFVVVVVVVWWSNMTEQDINLKTHFCLYNWISVLKEWQDEKNSSLERTCLQFLPCLLCSCDSIGFLCHISMKCNLFCQRKINTRFCIKVTRFKTGLKRKCMLCYRSTPMTTVTPFFQNFFWLEKINNLTSNG